MASTNPWAVRGLGNRAAAIYLLVRERGPLTVAELAEITESQESWIRTAIIALLETTNSPDPPISFDGEVVRRTDAGYPEQMLEAWLVSLDDEQLGLVMYRVMMRRGAN